MWIGNLEWVLIVVVDGDSCVIYLYVVALWKDLLLVRMIMVWNVCKYGIFGEYGNDCVDMKVIVYFFSG